MNFNLGDQVRINQGVFEDYQGQVVNIDRTRGRVTVLVQVPGGQTPVELEPWMIEAAETNQ